jgi:hypothetical protein
MKKFMNFIVTLILMFASQGWSDTVDDITITDGTTVNIKCTYSDGCFRDVKFQTMTLEAQVQISIFTAPLFPPGWICNSDGLTSDFTVEIDPPGDNYAIIASLYLCPNGVDSGGTLLDSKTLQIGSAAELPNADTFEVPPDTAEPELSFLDIKPEVINIKRNGKKIKAIINLPKGYAPEDIDDKSVELGIITGTGEESSTVLAQECKIINKALVAKFGSLDIIELIKKKIAEDEFPTQTTLFVKGKILDGPNFLGTDVVRVIKP